MPIRTAGRSIGVPISASENPTESASMLVAIESKSRFFSLKGSVLRVHPRSVDSRTILDASGAEKLLGSGDMLYITAELGKPKRVQGSYISEREVKNVVEFVAGQAGEVEYSPEILEKQRPGTALGGSWADDEDGDDMLEEAVDVVKTAGKASASLLQRRLRIGYARAARLLDLMEEKGLIGPADGAKPRDVYVAGAEADGVQREEGYGHDEEGEGT